MYTLMLSYEPIVVSTIVSYLGYSDAKFVNKAWRKHAKKYATGDELVGIYMLHKIFGDKLHVDIDPIVFSPSALATMYAYFMIYKKQFDYRLVSNEMINHLVIKYVIDNKKAILVLREIKHLCLFQDRRIVDLIEFISRRDPNTAKKIIHRYLSDDDMALYIRIIMRINDI